MAYQQKKEISNFPTFNQVLYPLPEDLSIIHNMNRITNEIYPVNNNIILNQNNNNIQPKMQIVSPSPEKNQNEKNKKKMSIKETFIQFQELFGNDYLFESEEQLTQTKKYNFNVIHYDEALTKRAENNICCSFFKTKLAGTFYGVNNFNLFKYICHKIQQNSKYFILICSGSSSQKLFQYLQQNNINNIYIYYIFCFNTKKYEPLKQIYPQLKGVFNTFGDLKNVLFSENNYSIIYNYPIKSSNLIFLSDYNNTYIKLHFEIVRKYSLYKLLKLNGKSKFLELINKKKPYYMNMAKELLYDDDEAMIEYFKLNTDESEEELRKVFNHYHNVSNYITNYTLDIFYYRYLNKFLREGDFQSFRLLSNHISKFIYHLYEFRKTNYQLSSTTLYRKLFMKPEEIQLYINSKGKIICYPSFTSTSLVDNKFQPIQHDPNTILVKLIIQQNNSPSIISIRSLSKLPYEEEYLCLPFSFFKIIDVEFRIENFKSTYIIYLIAMNSEKPIEEMFLEFMENETDNLDPEGLEMLKVDNNNNNTTLILNYFLKYELYSKYNLVFN